jgi:glycosidase
MTRAAHLPSCDRQGAVTNLTVTLFFLLAGSLQAAPTVTKVEPPNWWTGHSINPVRVLITGTGFTGAQATGTGIQIDNVKVSANGTYLFADVRVTAAGKHSIKIATRDGSVIAPFEVLTPLPSAARLQGFSPDDLIYLIMPDRFSNGDPSNDDPAISAGLFDRSKSRYYHGGDLQGVIDHLPYLKDLGVTTLWINPVYDNVNHLNEKERYDNLAITDYHGYGAVDFYKVEEHFGDLPKFREFVDKAHAAGLKVILDMVENHTGPYHPWVSDPPTPTWYHGTAASHINETWRTWTLLDPHAPAEFRKSTLDGWFADILPDLNQDDPETARYLIQNTLWWVDIAGLDGIREDTLPYVPRSFWHDWMAAIKRDHPKVRVVGEMFDGDASLVSYFQGGKVRDGIDTGVDTVFDFPMYYAIRDVFAKGNSVKSLSSTLSHDYLYPRPDLLVTFLGLHDVTRFMNESGATRDGLKLAFTYLFTTRGIPMIYYGDEIGMPGGNDPDNRRDFPGGWKEDPRNAFTPEGRTPEQADVFEYVRKLARLRQQLPDLRNGQLTELAITDNAYAFSRGEVIVALNNGKQAELFDLPVKPGTWHDALGSLGDVPAHFTLPPHAAAILIKK